MDWFSRESVLFGCVRLPRNDGYVMLMLKDLGLLWGLGGGLDLLVRRMKFVSLRSVLLYRFYL